MRKWTDYTLLKGLFYTIFVCITLNWIFKILYIISACIEQLKIWLKSESGLCM